MSCTHTLTAAGEKSYHKSNEDLSVTEIRTLCNVFPFGENTLINAARMDVYPLWETHRDTNASVRKQKLFCSCSRTVICIMF